MVDSNMFNHKHKNGFTLIEVLVAIAVIAVISVISVQAIESANRANEVTQRKLKQIHRLDRFWRFVEMDLRNALKYPIATPFGNAYEAMRIEQNEVYFLTHLRAGIANPLFAQRSELGRVGYRLEENTVWRDSWYDPALQDEQQAFKQKLIDGVDEVLIFALQPGVKTLEDRNWVEKWPVNGQQGILPLAVRVNLILEDGRDMTRIFTLTVGE